MIALDTTLQKGNGGTEQHDARSHVNMKGG